jgi:hypothetical protein
VTAGQLGLTGGAQPIFFPNPRKTSIQHFWKPNRKYAQTTPLDDGVSSLFIFILINQARYHAFEKVKFAFLQNFRHDYSKAAFSLRTTSTAKT